MVTIKDIARELGVSISTVSKGLNGGSDISDALRTTILDKAVEMGYTSRKAKSWRTVHLPSLLKKWHMRTLKISATISCWDSASPLSATSGK